ncbi:MAG: uracil-DNA glycosylase [Clostridia bacterium]|jgi:uracil-DNA glycosylase|nr:uracil-DNA glycosylase [Bacilli bacterium]MCI9010766.1 uracil-DNA glycosylase [Clostridia bacterium]
MKIQIGNDWDEKLKVIWESEGFQKFMTIVEQEYQTKEIFPPKNYIFNALKLTSFEHTKVVIVGQDPYHGVGEAHGLSFSVQEGIKVPPSLQNIYKELESDLGIPRRNSGDLTGWAKEGVLLLNAVLTVVKDTPASHRNLGWERLTDYIIKILNEKEEPVVFILWGNFAKAKKELITNPQHLVLTSAHPSPFAANYGFFGSKPFSKTNEFLKQHHITPINWDLQKRG